MHKSVYVADCDLGRGVFAARKFALGERVLELTGTVISLAEAIARGDAEANPLQLDDARYLDLRPPAVFVNHSCAPNTGVADERWLVALREIPTGEELRYDYSTTMHENRWTMACRCGATNCRGLVADFRLLPLDLQKHYLRLGVVQPFIVRALSGAPD